MYLALAVLCISPLLRAVSVTLAGHSHLPAFLSSLIGYDAFQNRADALAAGCILAGIRNYVIQRPTYCRFLHSRWFTCIPILTLALAEASFVYNIGYSTRSIHIVIGLLFPTLIYIGIALSIHRAVERPHGRLTSILNLKPVIFVGVISYSIYIWQQLFLAPQVPEWYSAFPINIVLTICVAAISYFVIERPGFVLRGKLDALLTERQRRLQVRPDRVEVT